MVLFNTPCKKLLLIFLIIFTLSLSFFTVHSSTHKPELDAWYLLDCTYSMVGNASNSDDILQKVIDTLIREIKGFNQGRITLITFGGTGDSETPPFKLDLDGNGPIEHTYTVEVNGPEDKQELLRFLRPEEYGQPLDESGNKIESWPGVYEAVKNRGGTSTPFYYVLEDVLAEMKERRKDYKNTEKFLYQYLVALTDGNETVVSERNRDDKFRQLVNTMEKMGENFYFKKYLYGKEEDPFERSICEDTGRGFCDILEVIESYKVYLLRPSRMPLSFPGVLWSADNTATISLKDVNLNYGPVDWGKVQISTEEFNIPSASAVEISPREVSPSEGEIDLGLKFKSFGEIEKSFDTCSAIIEGKINFDFSPKSSSNGLVDFLPPKIPVRVLFQKPNVNINISSGKSAMMKLSLDRNKAFSKLPSDLYIDYNSEEINLEGVEDNTIDSKTDFVTLNPNLTSGKLTPGYHEGEATLRAKNSRVKVNCKEETTVPYAFNLIRVGAGNKDEKLNVAFDNLSKTPGGSYEITKILNIQGLPDQWEDWGSLKVYQKESPQNMDMQQSITAEGNLKLTFSFPESSIGSLRAKLANSSLDAVLQFKFSPSQRGGVFNILESNSINLDFTVKDIGVSIGSCQGEGSLHFQSSEKTNNNWVFGYGSIEPRDSLFCLSVDYSNDISKSNRQLTIENKPMGIELVNSDGEKIAGSTSLEHIRVKAGEIDSGHYKGALKFTSKNDSITINYLKAPLSIRNEFTIPYIISVEPSSFNLQNLWGWSLDGDTRSVKREISLEGKWGLPEEGTISTSLKGLKGLTTKLSPYVQPNSFEPKPTQDIEIGLVGFPVERAFRQEEGKLQGSVVLHSKNPLVQFENRSIPFPLKLQRPSITVASTPSKPTDLGEKKEGEKVFSITVDYDELYQNLNLPPGIQYKIMPDNRDVFEVKQEGNDFSFYVKDDLSLDQETNFSGKVEFTPDEAARGITTLNGSLGKKQKSYSFAVNPAKVVVKSSKLKSGKMEPGSQLGEIEFSLTDQNLDAQETVLSYELTSDNLNASVEGSTIVLNGSKAEGNTGQLKLGSPGEESHVVRVTLADNLTGGLTGKDYQVAIDLNAPEGALIENIDGEKRKTVTLSTTLSIPGFLAALFWWVGIISLIVVAIYVVFIFSVSLMKKKLPNRVVVSQVYDKGIWVVGLLVVFLSLTVLSFLAKWLLLPLI